MLKALCLFLILPIGCLAQVTISGKIINQADTKPVANASVFLSNATAGTKTADDGNFSLHNIQPGKYSLVISIVGFENYSQDITVGQVNLAVPVITIFPKTIALQQVSIRYHKDPDRDKYLGWFEDEFLGTSDRAKNCKILNPELIDLSYDDANHKLTASSGDYLTIENDALGYKIKYLVTDFSLEKQSETEKKIFYKGPVHFEGLPGTVSQQKRWLKNRQELYENSPMHFLRSALNNSITEEDFRAQEQINAVNPNRPSDSLINARIIFFKQGKKTGEPNAGDSLSVWTRLSKLPKTILKTITLTPKDFIRSTNQPGMYAMIDAGGKMYVSYSKTHRFLVRNAVQSLYNANNDESTLVLFNSPAAFFYSNGVIINPYSLTYYGVWGKNRVAELLPIDYAPERIAEPESKISDNIVASLDTFIATHPTEKTYLQFDKPYYAAGDTIYFKSYVTMAGRHILSDLSGVLHVDLINPDNKISQSIKLRLDSGITWGDFALSDTLPKGNYRVRAYTTLMRTNDTLIAFDKLIPVGSLKTPGTAESISKQPVQQGHLKTDIQFFPEGGSLATGVSSKIAFKAVGPHGSGVEATGVVQDNTGKELATFASAHLGMGYFYLTPEPGKTYTAKITYSNGEQDVVNLPKAEERIALSVGNSYDPKITITLNAGKDYFEKNRNQDYTVLIFSGGASTTLNCKLDKEVVELDIEKSKLHTGITTITLFSSAYEPLCERLLFVNNNDQLDLKISNDKNSYTSREKVKISLSAYDSKNLPVDGHFSATVINESLLPENGNSNDNILTYFLFTSDLKGYVEQPAYYFSDTSAAAKNNLDILMLTQGYRRFEWKKIFSSRNKQMIAYEPEQAIEISGVVKNLSGKPVVNGGVTLLRPGSEMLNSSTDEKGVFHFSNLVFTDTAHFILSAVNPDGQNSTKLSLNPARIEPVIPSYWANVGNVLPDTTMVPYLNNLKNEKNDPLYYGNRKSILLREVKIRDIKLDNHYETSSLAGAGNADQVVHSKDLLNSPVLSDALEGVLKGVIIAKDQKNGVSAVPHLASGGHAMTVIVDGTQLLNADISTINTAEVESVEVLRFAGASMYGMNSGDGVLIITTKKGKGMSAADIESKGVLPIKVVGFYKAREFYSPKYDNAAQTVKQHDFRSTIYWQPELNTNKDGKASFEYYNADEKGTYKVVIEGIDSNGNIGTQIFRYNVN